MTSATPVPLLLFCYSCFATPVLLLLFCYFCPASPVLLLLFCYFCSATPVLLRLFCYSCSALLLFCYSCSAILVCYSCSVIFSRYTFSIMSYLLLMPYLSCPDICVLFSTCPAIPVLITLFYCSLAFIYVLMPFASRVLNSLHYCPNLLALLS